MSMTKADKQIQGRNHEALGSESRASFSIPPELSGDLSFIEQELLREILRSLRVIRYGSVVITVHDGQVVEIQRTERIRRSAAKQT